MAAAILTAERLREVLDYNAETGVFVWKTQRNRLDLIGRPAGAPNSQGYLHTMIDGVLCKNHRLAWLFTYGVWPVGEIDHIDGNRNNNAIRNLRDATKSVNQQNRQAAQSNNRHGLLGVCRYRKRWKSQITIDGEVIYLGLFDTPEQAHAAYLEAKRRLHPGCTI